RAITQQRVEALGARPVCCPRRQRSNPTRASVPTAVEQVLSPLHLGRDGENALALALRQLWVGCVPRNPGDLDHPAHPCGESTTGRGSSITTPPEPTVTSSPVPL